MEVLPPTAGTWSPHQEQPEAPEQTGIQTEVHTDKWRNRGAELGKVEQARHRDPWFLPRPGFPQGTYAPSVRHTACRQTLCQPSPGSQL